MPASEHVPQLPFARSTAPAVDHGPAQLIAAGAYGAALAQLLPDLREGPRSPELLDQAVTCYSQLGEGELAIDLMEEFVSRWPEVISGWTRLATLAANAGDTARAHHALRQGFRRGPKTAAALALLNRLSPIPRQSASARRLRALAERPGTTPRDRAIAMHTLGCIDDRAGRCRSAFRWFSAANGLLPAQHEPRAIAALVAGQILRFDPAHLLDAPRDQPRMMFITGMPRSGTTLVERCLSRHPQVRALGESPALGRTVMAMRRHMARTPGPGPVGAWDWFGALSQNEIAQFRRLFLSYLPADAVTEDRLLVSKMPLDCLEMGAAHLLLPDARFVFLDRHPLDVGLSNFCTQFHAGHGFSTRLDWTGHMIRSVQRSAEDYELKMGAHLRRQSYRALVQTPREEMAKLLSHAGLDWSEACLTPDKAAASSLTASAQQIREGLHPGALDRWCRYRAHLGALVDALGGADWIDAWERRDRGAGLSGAAV